MRKNKYAALTAVKRDLTAIALPTKLPLKKTIALLQRLTFDALRTGNTEAIENVCQNQLLALLNADTEVAVLKGGRRVQLSSEKVINEPMREVMPVRLSLEDSGTVQAEGTADYLRAISGIDPTETNNAFRQQNAVLIKGLSKEICDTIKKTIIDLTNQGVHVEGGTAEVANILLAAGVDPTVVPRLAETIFRTQSAAAYNAGRWNIVNDPDTAPYIWGFEYCTARDRRVRPEHRLLEGVRLPKDDPFWKKYLPPNGWNCRCTVLEIWNDEDIAKVDFGITGVDPRTRTDKELNLLPAFAGNVGLLSTGGGDDDAGPAGETNQPTKPSTPPEVRTDEPIKPVQPIKNTPKEEVERVLNYDIEARRVINKLNIQSTQVEPKVMLNCIPFKQTIKPRQTVYGWEFRESGNYCADVIARNNGKFIVNVHDRPIIINGRKADMPTIEKSFLVVRAYVAKQLKVKPWQIGIEWGNASLRKKRTVVIDLVPTIRFGLEDNEEEYVRGTNYEIWIGDIAYGNLLLKNDNTVKIDFYEKVNGIKTQLCQSPQEAEIFLKEQFSIHLHVPSINIVIDLHEKKKKYTPPKDKTKVNNNSGSGSYIIPEPVYERTAEENRALAEERKTYLKDDFSKLYTKLSRERIEKKLQLDKGEWDIFEYFSKLGGKVYKIKATSRQGKRPDCLYRGQYYEIKTPESNLPRTVAYRIQDAFVQQPDVVIINELQFPFNLQIAEATFKELLKLNDNTIAVPVEIWVSNNRKYCFKKGRHNGENPLPVWEDFR